MEVVVEPKVYQDVMAFYRAAMENHPSMTEEIVLRRITILEKAIQSLKIYGDIFHKTPYLRKWQALGYVEYECIDFHFAYKIEKRTSGERFVHVYDVVHSMRNFNKEDLKDLD